MHPSSNCRSNFFSRAPNLKDHQSPHSCSKKTMEIKVALLLVSALIAVAAAYPTKDQQKATAAAAGLDCDNDPIFEVFDCHTTFRLQGCTKDGQSCISGLPPSCYYPPDQCHYFFWYTESGVYSTSICKTIYTTACCSYDASPPSCDYVLAQEEATDDAVEGVRICETDANGDEHCRSLSEGKSAEAMQESDCFCVRDGEGHKVCEPDNCDAGRQAPKFAEEMKESDCFCVRDREGHKVCEPNNCDAGRQAPKFN
ncbi:hypothetical protein GBAR_LOCUS13764 [Geodia barretti]|uniref:Uncharacterized protein n=1 Tax=Geodia barretti TaxID=519541 RepID=A0AA35WNQ5_GEOBA|nr:hypothetical protein GBAR_LOCUS13764 [Geodia barretti]